jgi:hypothetical protein
MEFDVGKESVAVDRSSEVDVVEDQLEMRAIQRIVQREHPVVRLGFGADRVSNQRFRVAARERLHRRFGGLDACWPRRIRAPAAVFRLDFARTMFSTARC